MIAVLKRLSTSSDIDRLVTLLTGMKARSSVIQGEGQTVIEIFPANGTFDPQAVESDPAVDRLVDQLDPILTLSTGPTDEVAIGPDATAPASIGGKRIAVIAGPCSVESAGELIEIAHGVKEAGAMALRGGAHKPRTSPYSFRGHGVQGLEWLARAREETGLPVVTEVMSIDQVDEVSELADVLQIGSRNMSNFNLLVAVGRQPKPVLLKRGGAATLDEFIWAAEYIAQSGNDQVMLCERGIRTHERYVRNTLALAIVPELKRLTRLPVVVDPSHGTGQRHLVEPMSFAGVACGGDGLLVEVHNDPSRAWTDGAQSLDLAGFAALMKKLRAFAEAADRSL